MEIGGVVSDARGAYSGLERRWWKRSNAALMEACSWSARAVAAERSASVFVGVVGEGVGLECMWPVSWMLVDMAWKAECIWMGPVGGGIMPYIGPPEVLGACPRAGD